MSGASLGMRILKWLLVGLLLLAAISLVGIWQIGAWNILFPSVQHDTVAPTVPADMANPAVLIFSKTNSFRHVDGIESGRIALAQMTKSRGWGFYQTENGAVFNASDLETFSVVVFLNATGDMLSAAQEQAFQTWMEQGGGWLGIHAAGDSSHAGWQWYRDNLVGADFTAHIMGPQFQRASVILEHHAHPVLQGLPNVWQHEEEWYSWEKSPRTEGFTILATLDEDSYSPVQKMWSHERDLSMGDHPVVWSNCVGDGRSAYAAMGHQAEAFSQPEVRRMLGNALDWLASDTPDCATNAQSQ
ncbi:MAG: type 1 glutamine amidotransferase [Bacteroidia bacterium]|jgi:type 1 glutamine amidotransferase